MLKNSSFSVALAPMAGLTDAPMREMVADFGADAVVSEMIASQEWQTQRKGSREKSFKGALKHTRYIVQIAGRDPALMAEIARYIEDEGADQIDINMGCPAKHVNSGATAGAALLQDWPLALNIIETVSQAVNLPVSVKTRLGWSEKDIYQNIQDFQNAGAQALTIHARTRAQKYTGSADWQAVRAIKAQIAIPLWVNGDIVSSETAWQALQASGADGVMIGRATIGAPWLLSQIREDLQKSEFFTDGQEDKAQAQLGRRAPIMAAHYEKLLSHYGQELGMRMARKHLKAYLAPFLAEKTRAQTHKNDNHLIDKTTIQGIITATNPHWVLRRLAMLNV